MTEFSAITTAPLVSTIVLCYNQSHFVLETLESVKAQTYPNTQLIIVDDCSSDNSVEIIEGWLRRNGVRCTFIRHEENQGICKSLNDALAVAKGKYISMTAADDLWLPEKLSQQVEIMESQPSQVGMLYSDAFLIDEHGELLPGMFIEAHRRLPEMPQGRVLNALLEQNFVPAMTTLVRRSCYERLGFFDENLLWEDWDMWLRIARHYSFVYSPIPSAKYRRHSQSFTQSKQTWILKGAFDISMKHFQFGYLTDSQNRQLIRNMLNCSEALRKLNDTESSESLWALLQQTGNRRALWMYRLRMAWFSFRQRTGLPPLRLVPAQKPSGVTLANN